MANEPVNCISTDTGLRLWRWYTTFRQGAPSIYPDVLVGRSDAMNPLANIYAEGDTPYADKHLQPLDPIIVEGARPPAPLARASSSMVRAASKKGCL